MNIYVNEQELDASLTGEKTLAEVYEAVHNWISENKRYILGLRVDDTEVSPGELKRFDTTSVDRMDFYVGDELDMVLTTLDELDRYVDQIGSTLFSLGELQIQDVSNLKEGLSWIRQILESFSSILNMDMNGMNVLVPGSDGSEGIERILERLEKRAAKFSIHNERQTIEDFLEDLRSFKFFVMKLTLQLKTMNARQEDLIASLEKFEKHIPDLSTDIISINEKFNAGEDGRALELLDQITGILNEYLSALFALDYQLRRSSDIDINQIEVAGVSFRVMATDLTALLRDLSGALEENDIVATGDILEYELTEKLQLIVPYLTQIRQLVLASK